MLLMLGLLWTCESSSTTSKRSAVERQQQGPAEPAAKLNLLPTKNVMAINPRSFCKGVPNVLEITQQNFQEELAILCTGIEPTNAFYSLIQNAYRGGEFDEDIHMQKLFFDEVDAPEAEEDDGRVKGFVAYAMHVDRSIVQLLLGKEPYVATSEYENDGFEISFNFIDPPANVGDSDTGLRVEQFTSREGRRVEFEDTSVHDLKLYGQLDGEDIMAPGSQLNIGVDERETFPGAGSVEMLRIENDLSFAKGAAVYNKRKSEINNYLLIENSRDLTLATEHLLDKNNANYHVARGILAGMKSDKPGHIKMLFVNELVIKNRIDADRLTSTIMNLSREMQRIMHGKAVAAEK